MDTEELQKNIALYYSQMPADVQVEFSSMEWLETLRQISEKYALTEKQIEVLGTETTLVLLRMIDLDEYERMIRSNLELSDELIKELATDVNEHILKNIYPETVTNTTENEEVSDPVIHTTITPKISTPVVQTDNQVLSSAGIEITSTIPETPKPQMPITEKREEILAKVEKPDDVIKSMPTYTPPAMPVIPTPAQTAPVPIVTTTQQSMAPVYTPPTHTNPAPISSPAPVSKADPYRMPIE